MAIKTIILTSLFSLLAMAGIQLSNSFVFDNDHIPQLVTHEILPTDTALGGKNRSLLKWPTEIQTFIKRLTKQYSNSIHQTHIQAKLIYIREPLSAELLPPIEDKLKSVLASAFPGHSDNIIAVWARMDLYEAWLLTENRTLMELDALSRSGLLWQKRNELFPIAATDIWSEEQDKYETAQLNLHSEIDLLDKSYNLPMSERIERLEKSFLLADNFLTSSLDQTSEINTNTIASVLFGLSAVQQELQQLDPEHRQLEIDSIRRDLGYNEDSIIHMSNLDTKREERWSNGYAYMNSREQLLASNDQVSEHQLHDLRTQFFGSSAETISREEVSGFYRFQRPRYYGRN